MSEEYTCDKTAVTKLHVLRESTGHSHVVISLTKDTYAEVQRLIKSGNCTLDFLEEGKK